MTADDFHICAGCNELIPVVAGSVFADGSYYCNAACFDRRTVARDFDPLKPREHDPLSESCQVCGRAWKSDDKAVPVCACGETQGDVLDLEHALSAGATMEAKGVLR